MDLDPNDRTHTRVGVCVLMLTEGGGCETQSHVVSFAHPRAPSRMLPPPVGVPARIAPRARRKAGLRVPSARAFEATRVRCVAVVRD